MNVLAKTILFVEDNPLVLDIYRNWLQRDGFNVASADDGLMALEKLPQLKPDLVILDLMLPRLNGLEVLKFIRKHSDLKAIPVLILSNAYMNESASKVMLAGASQRMLKTQCTPAKLIAAVRGLLGVAPAPHGQPENDSALAETNEALLKEARINLLEDASKHISRIRELCLAFVKTAGSPVSTDHLNDLYQQVRFLCARATSGDCSRLAHLVSALEAMLFDIICRRSLPSASALQTVAQAVDCLGRLLQNGDTRSADDIFKAKVLIVDDDPICNFTTVAAMRRAKLEAISTELPAAALKLAQTELFRILLLDINMPGLNGFELCKQIRLLPQYKRTPIIFVTSHSEFQNRAQAVLSGGDDLISKPIFPLELVLKTIMLLIESTEEGAVNSPAGAAIPSSITPAVSSLTKSSGLSVGPLPVAAEKESAKAPASANGSDKTGATPGNGRFIASAKANVSNRDEHLCPPPEAESPPPLLFSPEGSSVNRINPPKRGTYHEMLMKNRNENQPFEMISREVTRIIFGDENLSEMPLRLTRIALERYHVQEIISRGSGSGGNGSGSLSDAASNDPFGQVAREVTQIIFGEEGLSEMHLRLTSIALQRYHVPEIMLGLPGTNGQDCSSAEPGSCRRV
jgi:DNA-binding response OmpR family regulator